MTRGDTWRTVRIPDELIAWVVAHIRRSRKPLIHKGGKP